ncbi:lasso peptide biosynthesis B2 protein [Streptosporangium sp. NPDC051023]|uniref:lasso peptide biosynthesis B2 protein n=1 Tax=Streptosporangium sp. NPDC051023 TaxID=3155410 RepID=UPI0034503CCC
MTMPQTISIDPASLSRRDRLFARVAVFVARRLEKRSPLQIQRVLFRLRRGARPARYGEASRARSVVVRTSWACSGPNGCLPRALATAILCRMWGFWPTWCVGARVTPPFGAHAWVRAEGRDVDEDLPPDYLRVLVEVGPGGR